MSPKARLQAIEGRLPPADRARVLVRRAQAGLPIGPEALAAFSDERPPAFVVHLSLRETEFAAEVGAVEPKQGPSILDDGEAAHNHEAGIPSDDYPSPREIVARLIAQARRGESVNESDFEKLAKVSRNRVCIVETVRS